MKTNYKQKMLRGASRLGFALFLLGSVQHLTAQEVSFGSSGLQGESLNNPTSLDFGPDGKLYVAQVNGTIFRYSVTRDDAAPGEGEYSVTDTEAINTVQLNTPNHTDDGLATTVQIRQITGILAAGTEENPILYVTSSDNLIGGGGSGNDKNLDTNSGVLSKLTYNGGSWDKVDLVRGLPRCEENHSINGLDLFERDGETYALVQQGGHSNKGAPSNNFVGTPEYLMSGAILIVNLSQLESMPVYTDPRSNTQYVYDLPTLNDPEREDITNVHPNFPYGPEHPLYNATIDLGDPFGGDDGLNQAFPEPNGPVQIFSPGYRNAYDVVVTENGNVYTFDNGPNTGWGGLPLIYDANGNLKGDEATTTYNPENGDYISNEFNENGSGKHGDTLHHVGTIDDENNTYYGGHPIPILAFPNKADLITYKNINGSWQETARYQLANTIVGVSGYFNNSFDMSNFPEDPRLGKYLADAEDSDEVNILDIIVSSTNGMCEYTASNFDGAMKGDLLAASFNGNITRYQMNAAGDNFTDSEVIFGGFGNNPLDVIALPDGHPFAGTVWAATYGADNITIFEPTDTTCITTDNPSFDPSADYDNDGYTNQDELDNGTNYCSGGSTPRDNDNDEISDLNDLDDDNDGILDNIDAFAIDPSNGLTTNLPINYSFFNNDPGTGFFGLGFTGLMLDPTGNTNYLDQFDEDNLSFGGAAGKASIDLVSVGDAISSQNSQDNAFHFGINVDTNSDKFTIQTRLESPFFGINGAGTNPVNYQSAGLFIGTGDQDNYLKFVLQNGIVATDDVYGVQLLLESNGAVSSSNNYDIPNIIDGNAVDFFLSVDPANNTAQPFISIDGGTTVNAVGSAITLPADFLDPNDDHGLAVGILSTAIGNGATPFSAIWDYMYITEDNTGVLSSASENLDFGAHAQNGAPVQINLEILNENGPSDGGLTITDMAFTGADASLYSTSTTANFEVGPGARYTIPVEFNPSTVPGSKTAALEIAHTGEDSPLVIPIVSSINANLIPVVRINAGGALVNSVDNGPNWLANATVGATSNATFSVNTGNLATFNLDADNRDSSIPDYIDAQTFESIFANEKWDPASGAEMEYAIPLANGNYVVNLYVGNGFGGTDAVGDRVYDILIEDVIVQNDFDLISAFGHQVGGMLSFPVSLSDGSLSIAFGHETENPLINAIEIMQAEEVSSPLTLVDIEDRGNVVGDEVDFAVSVSGGDPGLNYQYSIIGQPDGIEIEPTNGQVFGTILSTAVDGGIAHDGVLTTVITVSQENGESVSTEFTWTITPAPGEWIDLDEDQNYVQRHECSFVQAGDRFIMFGGRESSDQLDVYDYENDSWSTGGQAPEEFNHFQATTYKGLVWVIGAFKDNSFPNETPAEHIYIYNPATEEWIQGLEIPENRRRGGAGLVVHNDKFYVIGGNTIGHNGGYVNWFDEYDPNTGEWTALADAPHARDHFHAGVNNGKLYAIGGRLSGGPQGVFAPLVPEVDVYDFETNSWSTLNENLNIPTPRAAPAVAVFEDEIFIMGGEGTVSGPAFSIVEAFNTNTNAWADKPSMNFARHGTQAIVSGDGIFVAGGSPTRGGGRQRNMEVYNANNPTGEVITASDLLSPPAVEFRYDLNQSAVSLSVPVENVGGNAATYIRSISVSGTGFSLSQSYDNILIGADESIDLPINFTATNQTSASATVTVIYNNDSLLSLQVLGFAEDDGAVVNLALNKSVSVSSQQAANPGPNIVDGDPDSRWSAQNFPQSVTVDLGDVFSISNTEVIAFNDRAYHYLIEASNSLNGTYSTIVDRSANTTPGTNANPTTDTFAAVDAQFVRITVLDAEVYGGSWASIEELRVFGTNASQSGTNFQSSIFADETDESFSVFPNPAKDFIQLTAPETVVLEEIRIQDISGNIISVFDNPEALKSGDSYQINTASYSFGMYFMVLTDSFGNQSSIVFAVED